jgi:hypothetical protein
MTHHELDQIVADLVTQLSTQGVENPISCAAIERTGRTSSGSSSPTQRTGEEGLDWPRRLRAWALLAGSRVTGGAACNSS